MKKETRKLMVKLIRQSYSIQEIKQTDERFSQMHDSVIQHVMDEVKIVTDNSLVTELRNEIESLNSTINDLNSQLNEARKSLSKLTAERGKWLRKIKRLGIEK